MAKMTLNEAIQHCDEVVAEAEIKCAMNNSPSLVSECAEEHMQLSHWLKELKRRREEDESVINKALKYISFAIGSSDGDNDYFIGFRNGLRLMKSYFDETSPDYEKCKEQSKGYWIDHQDGRWIYAKCSKCGKIHDARSNYCPDCGVIMSKESEGEIE